VHATVTNDGTGRLTAILPAAAALTTLRCPNRDCNRMIHKHALVLGSVVEYKCECNVKLLIIQTAAGLYIVESSAGVLYDDPRSRLRLP
jgi:hypothetical protein